MGLKSGEIQQFTVVLHFHEVELATDRLKEIMLKTEAVEGQA